MIRKIVDDFVLDCKRDPVFAAIVIGFWLTLLGWFFYLL